MVPLGCRRFMHLVVFCGHHGADSSAEKLQLTNQLFEAALGELAVVARVQPCLIVGDFNVEPTKIPCLAKGISAELWVDLEASWATAAGRAPAVTCKRTWDSDSGNRRVVGDRWVQPHLAVRTWFVADRWTACVTLGVLGLLKFVGFWDIYDERLGWVGADDALTIDGAVASGDVSGA